MSFYDETVQLHIDALEERAERALAAEAEVARLTTLLEQRTAALTRTIDAKNAAEAKVARVEKFWEGLAILGDLPIEKRPDGLTASVEACRALARDLRDALDGSQT